MRTTYRLHATFRFSRSGYNRRWSEVRLFSGSSSMELETRIRDAVALSLRRRVFFHPERRAKSRFDEFSFK